jgi:hypothetical protein
MASTYLSKNLPANQNSLHKWTYSGWVKRSEIGNTTHLFNFYDDANNRGGLRFNSDNTLMYYEHLGGSTVVNKTTNRVFRDVSAWYHVMVAVDKSVSSPDTQIYINGVEETSFSTDNDYSQNQTTKINDTDTLYINSEDGSSNIHNQLMAHVHWVSGYKLTPATFGETDSTSGIWKPKTAPSVTYGTNGFFLKFENSGAMGTDSSGNSNTFTVHGTLTQNVDTPSNNFATLNPLDVSGLANTGNTFSNGNLTVTDGSSNYLLTQSSLAVTTGKFYWEVKINSTASDTASGVGIADLDNFSRADGGGNTAYGWLYAPDGDKRNSGTSTAYGDTYAANDIIGIALDMTNGFLYFSKNGTWQNSGDPTSGASGTGSAYGSISGTIGCHLYDGSSSIAHEFSANFGQGYFGTTAVASAGTAPSEGGIFEYDCPSGYQALCTKGINSF